jgi:predicted Fe-Mo cluster-binding NifX family protein
MNTMRIAVPSQSPNGLSSKRSEHFGHSELFTLVDILENTVTGVQHIENTPHGSCMMPVKLLQDYKVNALIVSDIGAKPLQGFTRAGISVFFAPKQPCHDVRSLLEGMARKEFSVMDPKQACKGHGSCRVKPI